MAPKQSPTIIHLYFSCVENRAVILCSIPSGLSVSHLFDTQQKWNCLYQAYFSNISRSCLKCWTWKIFPHLKYRSWSNHLSGRNYYASSHHLYFTQSYDLSHSAGSLNPIESLFRKACWSCQILTWSWTVPLSWDSLYPLVCSVYDQMFSSIEKIKSRGDSSHLVLVVLDP